MGILSKGLKCCSVLTLLLAVLIGLLTTGTLTRWGLFRLWSSYSDRVVGLAPAMLSEEELSSGWSYDALPALDGKVALVTGANIGLGYWTALHLARKGAEVVMACRTMSKCDAAASTIKDAITGSGSVVTMHVDTSSLSSVQTFAGQFKSRFSRLDMLVCNAGLAFAKEELSVDGIETVFATNHLGHFKLYKDLHDLLEHTAQEFGQARVVAVSSAASYTNEPLRTDLALIRNIKSEKYGHSKLCNVLFVQEIARQMKEQGKSVYANACHPGAVDTNIWTQLIGLIRASLPAPLAEAVVSVFMQIRSDFMFTSEEGARTQVFLAAADDVHDQKITGQYYHPITRVIDRSQNINASWARELWDFSARLLEERGF